MFISGRICHTMAEISIPDDNVPPCIQSEIDTSESNIYIALNASRCAESKWSQCRVVLIFVVEVIFISSSTTWYVNKWLWCCSSVGK